MKKGKLLKLLAMTFKGDCFVAMRLIKKMRLLKLLAMTFVNEIALALIRFIKKMNIIGALGKNVFTWANSTPRRHCEAKEKTPGERKFIAEAISFSSPPLVRGTQKTK